MRDFRRMEAKRVPGAEMRTPPGRSPGRRKLVRGGAPRGGCAVKAARHSVRPASVGAPSPSRANRMFSGSRPHQTQLGGSPPREKDDPCPQSRTEKRRGPRRRGCECVFLVVPAKAGTISQSGNYGSPPSRGRRQDIRRPTSPPRSSAPPFSTAATIPHWKCASPASSPPCCPPSA